MPIGLWKVTLSHVREACRKEVAQAFIAAGIDFPGVKIPNVFKASGACNDQIFEAFRKHFDSDEIERRTAEHNTVEMENPDLSFFVELYGETGGVVRKITTEDKGTLSDEDWKESVFKILHEVTSHVPRKCREETGLLFDVGIGESLDIGFVDGKKNFKITERCFKYTYTAVTTFFKKLSELQTAAEIKEDLVDRSMIVRLIEDWRDAKVQV
nr:unnamed protein product [Callosobruchus analis]